MSEKYYDIYFDPSELEVDGDGDLTNWDALYILEYNEDGKVTNRVDYKGNLIAFGNYPLEKILDLYHVGEGDNTLKEALDLFWKWLQDNTEWVETSPQTYWQPAEYKCIGITGYCGYADEEDDDDAMERYRLRWHL